jgi:hypothetical protein
MFWFAHFVVSQASKTPALETLAESNIFVCNKSLFKLSETRAKAEVPRLNTKKRCSPHAQTIKTKF